MIDYNVLDSFLMEMISNAGLTGFDMSTYSYDESAQCELALKAGFDADFVSQYKTTGSFHFSWRSNVPDTGQMDHTIRVKPLTHILEHKDCGLFHEDDLEMNPALEDFYVVDDFIGEACVGIFAGKHSTKTLYYVDKGNWETISTGLDLSGYYEMYLEAKGFFYWQYVIIQELILGKVIPEGDRMRHDLPLIFPGWSWENFVAKFKSLYIKELIP